MTVKRGLRLPYYLHDRFNRQSIVSRKILKQRVDRNSYYIISNGSYYKFFNKSKPHMIRGYHEFGRD